MECPYFKNITFQKIEEIIKQQSLADLDDMFNLQIQDKTVQNDPFNDFSESIPEQGPTGCLQHYESKINRKSYDKVSENFIESNKIIPIKMPKIMDVKNLHKIECQNIDEQNEEGIANIKETHILEVRKMSNLNIPFNIFHGNVILLPQNKQYNIHLAMQILKINHCEGKEKIKYFIELWKTKITIQKLNQNTLNLIVVRKNVKEQIKLQFLTIKDASIFQNVLDGNLRNKEQEFFTDFEESSSSSLFDSLRFTVERMPFNDVLAVADTFDILLFKNKNIMSKVQRFFTNSDFDHVALLMRTMGNSVLMIQSTSNAGVSIYNFYSLRGLVKRKHFSRLALRRYLGKKKDELIKRLQTFIHEVNGKKYKFDPMYLVSSSICKSQQQTFFCSELVAEALQVTGIMKKDKPSYKFLPKHFGNEDQFNNEIEEGEYSSIIVID